MTQFNLRMLKSNISHLLWLAKENKERFIKISCEDFRSLQNLKIDTKNFQFVAKNIDGVFNFMGARISIKEARKIEEILNDKILNNLGST